MMNCIDTDVFAIDLIYTKDKRFEVNQQFLESIKKNIGISAGTTIFNLLELCGLLSFSNKPQVIEKIFIEFHKDPKILVLYPNFSTNESCLDFFEKLVAKSMYFIKRKMSFGDALIIWTCEENNCSTLITWNAKHFENRSDFVRIITPEEFLKKIE